MIKHTYTYIFYNFSVYINILTTFAFSFCLKKNCKKVADFKTATKLKKQMKNAFVREFTGR